MILEEFQKEKQGIRTATIIAHARQRVADVSASLSRKGIAMAQSELCNEAVAKLISLVYEPDTDGGACNVDRNTGRLLIPVPWGSVGYNHYGLRQVEANTLRAYMIHLSDHKRPIPLFTLDGQNWYLNFFDYTTVESALNYWRITQLDARVWKQFYRPHSRRI